MTTTATPLPGQEVPLLRETDSVKAQIYESIKKLAEWLKRNDYRGYDTFDGLNSALRVLTFENKLLRTALQQSVRRFPLNIRPLIGISKESSTKGMGFLARGFIRLHQATGEEIWRKKAEFALTWLINNRSAGYSGACWGNHFDYQSRSLYVPEGTPSVVWTSLIGHSFLDAYGHFGNDGYLQVAVSACDHIMRDLDGRSEGDDAPIRYFPQMPNQIHNANTLGASLLARTYAHTNNENYRALAERAIHYTVQHQLSNGGWYYGEAGNLHWVDNFHTAYVLDSLKYYEEGTGDRQFNKSLTRGYDYWKNVFFMPNGAPRYYDNKTLPLDIQCCAQAIDTLVFFRDRDPDSVPLALNIAVWTMKNMQDRTGYFYYRRYSKSLVNKTPTLHWGQGTMLSALSSLYQIL